MEVRYASSNKDAKSYDTKRLREEFLIENIFVPDKARLVYSHYDRIIAGGICPVLEEVALQGGNELGSDYFLQGRELGVINVGGKGQIIVDDKIYDLDYKDALYVGKGEKNVKFKAMDSKNPPKFYINSAPAHKHYLTKLITLKDAKKVHTGSIETSNKRTINQYIHPDVLETCQLSMGMTELHEGSVWNSMPTHTHDRRMEVYFYFDMAPDTRIFHLMGEKAETRHIVMKNDEAVISPSWSIHSGVGTGKYAFIWGMCGENKIFTDMDHIAMEELR